MLAGGNIYVRVIGVMEPRSTVAEGSEMADGTWLGVGNCIHVPQRRSAFVFSIGLSNFNLMLEYSAVSYTHLRAHET